MAQFGGRAQESEAWSVCADTSGHNDACNCPDSNKFYKHHALRLNDVCMRCLWLTVELAKDTPRGKSLGHCLAPQIRFDPNQPSPWQEFSSTGLAISVTPGLGIPVQYQT